MKLKSTYIATFLTISLLALPMASFAEDTKFLEPRTTATGIEYVSGGVGDEEKAELDAERKNYNFRLTFTEPQGAYLAGVKVKVNNKKEEIINVTADGPFFFAKLPAGTYTVTAESDGKTQTRRVVVNKNATKNTVFIFPASQAE